MTTEYTTVPIRATMRPRCRACRQWHKPAVTMRRVAYHEYECPRCHQRALVIGGALVDVCTPHRHPLHRESGGPCSQCTPTKTLAEMGDLPFGPGI
jgi:hypothetical protein